MSWTLWAQLMLLILWVALLLDFLLHSQARRASDLLKEARNGE